MVPVCPQCRRANPSEARYCHHDGTPLTEPEGAPSSGAINMAVVPFTVPFVFPSGQKCRNFNELVLTCQSDANAALESLRKGHLEAFLAAQGRGDLAEAAHIAAHHADRARGLDEFLIRLPSTVRTPPKLTVEAQLIDVGTVRLGEDRTFELVLKNDGMGLLFGSTSCGDCPWLSFGTSGVVKHKVFQFSDRLVLPMRVRGRHVRAYRKPQETELVLESNGGSVSVHVRINVPPQPFKTGSMAGALSPRQFAEKARQMPEEAAALIENGAVSQWYKENGWAYPVVGPTAHGRAAVQQLFDALGLVKPPKVEMSEDQVRLSGRPGEAVEHVLAVVTHEDRMVVAHGVSDQPWLQIGRTVFRGRSAFLPLVVRPIPDRPGETLQAQVTVSANGGQQFLVPVVLKIAERTMPVTKPAPPVAPVAVPVKATLGSTAGPAPAPIAIPVGKATQPAAAVKPVSPPPAPARSAPAPAVPVGVLLSEKPRREERSGPSILLIALPALLLIVALAGVVARDYFARAHVPIGLPPVAIDAVPRLEIRFHDLKRTDELEKLWLPDPQPTMRFGVVTLAQGKEVGSGVTVRRLTFDPWGRTNNTCLRFDKADDRLFGGPQGRWEQTAIKDWKDALGKDHAGVKSVWICDDKKIEVIQMVELVRGEQSNLLDTCRVSYRLTNLDSNERSVGIRFLLDTFIGGNDGVPFTIPGDSDLCTTMKDLPSQAKDHKLPDFLQALEKPDLERPGTIAHLRLKVDRLEAPERVTLGAWPSDRLRIQARNANGPATLWDVPLLPMGTLNLNDSAIVMYWKQEVLKPGQTREVGFEYGLWNLASKSSQLATTLDGAFRPDGALTVVAYVGRTVPEGTTLTLTLPEGFQFLEGTETQTVPKLPDDAKISSRPLTWKVKAGPTGKYQFTVKTSTGLVQTLPLEINSAIFD
jgi:hypothetical protein